MFNFDFVGTSAVDVNSVLDFLQYGSGDTAILSASVLLVAICSWRIVRRLIRLEQAVQILAGDHNRARMQILGLERLQYEADKRLSQLVVQFHEVQHRLRLTEARQGKPDQKLASALSRAGVDEKRLVDFGLSHGEAQLLQALNANSLQHKA